jgi:hypothetical protein
MCQPYTPWLKTDEVSFCEIMMLEQLMREPVEYELKLLLVY